MSDECPFHYTMDPTMNNCNLKIFNSHSNDIYMFIVALIQTVVVDTSTETINISCRSVMTLSEYLKNEDNYMPMNTCISLIDCVSKQIKFLEKRNLGYYAFDIADFIVIDNIFFVNCNSSKIVPIHKSLLEIHCWIEPSDFSSPELLSITELPGKIDYRSSYYSLGLLVVFVLMNKNLSSALNVGEEIACLDGSKLYWFLSRCLDRDPKKRHMLLI